MGKSPDLATKALDDPRAGCASVVGKGGRDGKCEQPYHLEISNPEVLRVKMAGKSICNGWR